MKYFVILLFSLIASLSADYNITELKVMTNISGIQTACELNELGQVTGRAHHNSKNHLYLWTPPNSIILQPDTRKTNITDPYVNNNSEISHVALNDAGDKYWIDQGRLIRNGVVVDGSHKWLNNRLCVNNFDQVAGVVELPSEIKCAAIFDCRTHTFTSSSEKTKFPLIPSGINDLGQVVGSYFLFDYVGFVWTPSYNIQYFDNFKPTAINNHGTIVGALKYNGEPLRGCLYENGIFRDLTHDLKLEANFNTELLTISNVMDINDRGEMLISGKKSNGRVSFFVLTPINH